MGDVNLPNAIEDLGGGDNWSSSEYCSAIDQRCGISRHENENLGGVAEADGLNREVTQDVSRNVIDEDQKKGDPPKKVEPQVANRGGFDRGVVFSDWRRT